MHMAVVIGKMISTDKYDAYERRKLLLVQKLDMHKKPLGTVTMAIDYVDAGEGDIVLVGAAPGLASSVFGIEKAPIRELVMGVIDRVNLEGDTPDFGQSIRSQ